MCYILSFLITVKDNMSFRSDFIIQLLTGFLYSFANVTIIHQVMSFNSDLISKDLYDLSINYIILSSTISAAFFFSVPPGEITQKIVSGDIVRELLYPYSYIGILFAQCLGRFVTIIFIRIIPSIIMMSIIFKPNILVKWDRFFIFIILLLIGYLIYFLISTIIDLVSFWRQETYYFHYVKEGIFILLSGSTIPMWFYPEWLMNIASYTPFKWIIYGPISIFMNEENQLSIFTMLILSLSWLTVLIMVCSITWKKGIKKVIVFGG